MRVRPILVLVLLPWAVLGGCSLDQDFVLAIDGYTKEILPEYRAYVERDPELSEDTKRIRLQSAERFQRLVDEAKEETP